MIVTHHTREAPWSGRRPTAVVFGPQPGLASEPQMEALRAVVRQHAEVMTVEPGEVFVPPPEADLAVVFGGDGSILRAARQMDGHQLPTLGVNLGRLGFLAAISPDELVERFPAVCQGVCRIVDHLMMACSVYRGDEVVAHQLGLNEAAILGGPPYSILDVDLYVDGLWATTYSCDGLIISTPVGSTAHSLSAGGPILRKTLQAFVISPISPHTLTVRPVVDDADRTYEMVVRQPHEATSVVVDGQAICRLLANDRVRIARASQTFSLIETAGQNDYRTLREKLGWRGSLATRRSDPH